MANMTTREKYRPKRSDTKNVKVFSISEEQCVWMKARVVNFKLCNNSYDCANCAFDKAMSQAWTEARDLRDHD